ncbi:MAG: 2Fe-2S iron-sulfur cluster-binding protein [Anaerolineales bacterium]|nr:2Fe-2S iron-sulfur cluster-binding protein [Anaerolineales bacterium]MDW8445819.1 2Fe-2S iron-sulfur cluster-binding protein [Anaerolineales bacterium]
MTTLRMTINGRVLEAERGETILQTARRYGFYIPTLCDYAHLTPHGSCRLCIVEVEGSPKTPAACTTPVEEGMVVRTHSPRLQALRSEILRLLLSEHPVSCLVCPEQEHCDECMITLRKSGVTTGCRSCPKDGLCELQELVVRIGLSGQSPYPVFYRGYAVEKGDPFFDRDYNLCILCGRCLRVCEELHFATTLTYVERGSRTLVGTAFGRNHVEAGCSFCGACVEVCPTGALIEKYSKWDGRPDGEVKAICPLCSLNCELRLLTKKGQVINSLPTDLLGKGPLCLAGRFGIPELVNHPQRLKTPLLRETSGWRQLTWGEAAQVLADKLFNCSPENFGLLVSESNSNEDLYVAQKFARVVMRTHQVSTLAAQRYGEGFPQVVELMRHSVSLQALSRARTVLCVGLDVRYLQAPVEYQLVQAYRRRTRLVTLHSRPHSLSLFADVELLATPGQEALLLNELLHLVRGRPTSGKRMSKEQLSALAQAAKLLSASPVVVLVGPEALESIKNKALLGAVQALAKALHALVIPLPAQGNLSGALMMGAFPYLLPGGYSLDQEEQRQKVIGRWSTPLPAISADPLFWRQGGRLRVLMTIGENPPKGLPDSVFVVMQHLYPPPDQKVDLLLPLAAFSETSASWIDYAGVMHVGNAVAPPSGEALPAWQMLCQIARSMGARGFDFNNAEEVRAEIARLVSGFVEGGTVDRFELAVSCDHKLRQPQPGAEPEYLSYPLSHWIQGWQWLLTQR